MNDESLASHNRFEGSRFPAKDSRGPSPFLYRPRGHRAERSADYKIRVSVKASSSTPCAAWSQTRRSKPNRRMGQTLSNTPYKSQPLDTLAVRGRLENSVRVVSGGQQAQGDRGRSGDGRERLTDGVLPQRLLEKL